MKSVVGAKHGHCVVLSDSLSSGRVPDSVAQFISDVHLHWLGGVQLMEVICLEIPEPRVEEAIAFLKSDLRPRGFYAHVIIGDEIIVAFPDEAHRAKKNDNDGLDRIRERGRTFGIPLSQMRFDDLFIADHPNFEYREHLPADRRDVLRPTVTGAELAIGDRAGSACICGRIMGATPVESAIEATLSCDGVNLRTLFPAWSTLEIGDVVGVQGDLSHTPTGPCLTVMRWGILTPTRWPSQFSTTEDRREIMFLRDRRLRNSIIIRRQVIAAIRRFLDERGFLEVDTPIMLPVRDIAPVPHFSISPSATGQHVLRICPENFLKRLIVAGFDRVYEIGRSFRVEAHDAERLSEFTSMECYQAFSSYEDMATLCHDLIVKVTASVLQGDPRVHADGHVIDLAQPWKRIDFPSAVIQHAGIDVNRYSDDNSLVQAMTEKGISVAYGSSRLKCMIILAEHVEQSLITPASLITPTFLMDHPAETICVAKRHAERARAHLIERFELFIGGREIAHGFSELTDPVEQRERMKALLDEKVMNGEATHPCDEDFLSSLDIGLPPTAGLGIGIDRLVMLLTGEPIDRVVTFA